MGPIRGQTRPLPVTAEIAPEARHIDAKLNASIHNRFDIEVIDSATGEVRRRANAENVICDTFWAKLLDSTYYTFYCVSGYISVGSGSGVPAASDTALFKELIYKQASGALSNLDFTTKTAMCKKYITLDASELVGSTITEVGCGIDYTWSSHSYNGISTHAMLKDANGNQISITKTATDIIKVYATIYVHWNETPAIGLSSCQSFLSSLASGNINTVFGGMSESGPGVTSSRITAADTITAASKTITGVYTRITNTQCNGHGIYFLELSYFGTLFMGYDFATKWNPGSDVTAEAIGTGDGSTCDFQTNFCEASNVTVYVDGAAASGVTIDNPKPYNPTNISPYLRPITSSGVLCWYQYESTSVYNYFYNPWYSLGFKTITSSYEISLSNDLETWVIVSGTIPAAYKNYKYLRIKANLGTNTNSFSAALDTPTKNIHFLTAPAVGAVITANYHTDTIAKDASHVFDLTVSIKLGEHTS